MNREKNNNHSEVHTKDSGEISLSSQSESVSSSAPIPIPEIPLWSTFSTYSFTPGVGLLAASFPLIAGAYIGYRREMTHAQSSQAYLEKSNRGVFSQLIDPPNSKRNVSKAMKEGTTKQAQVVASEVVMAGPGPAFFARALLYGTFLSIGGVSLLSAGK